MVSQEEKAIRVVLDTNVVISAILFKEVLCQFETWWRDGIIIPLVSKDTFEEIRKVLIYPKFQLSEDEVNYVVMELLLPYFEVITLKGEQGISACRDHHDDKFLFTAHQGKAEYLISGDQDLLIQKRYRKVRIVSPKGFKAINESK